MAPQRGFHVGGPISRLQLVRYVQAPTLAWPPVRAHPDLSSRAAGPYTPRNGRAVSHSNCGIATCPNRATDMPGLSPGRSWPYRPLHHPLVQLTRMIPSSPAATDVEERSEASFLSRSLLDLGFIACQDGPYTLAAPTRLPQNLPCC